MLFLEVLIGIIALTIGRQLYWLFVSAVGVIVGVIFASQYMHGLTDSAILGIAIGSGIAGMILAFALQRFAVVIAGFAVSGYLLLRFLDYMQYHTGQMEWLAFVIGGLIGTIFFTILFDWTLIVVSSLTGTLLIVESIRFTNPAIAPILFISLFVIGIAIQLLLWQQEMPARA